MPHKKLMTIFKRVIAAEEAVVSVINNYGGSLRLSAVGWQFTLPDLYGLCCQLDAEIGELDYRQFRQYLYRHPINQEIAGSGSQFLVIRDRGHIDRNVYGLIDSGNNQRQSVATDTYSRAD